MGLAGRFASGGLIRFFIRLWLALVGLIGVVCAVIAIPGLPGDHSTADSYHHAVACPAGHVVSTDCVYQGEAPVTSVADSFRPGSRNANGTHSGGQYETRITLVVPLTGGTPQVVTVDGPAPIAGQLPAGTTVPVTVWRGSVIRFTVLGAQHDSGTNPDFKERRDKILLLAGLPVALLTLRLLAWSVFGRRVRRGPFRLVDGALAVLAGATAALVLGGLATAGVIVAGLALAVLAGSWAGARFGMFGG